MKERRQIERQRKGRMKEACVYGRTFSFNTISETLHYKPEITMPGQYSSYSNVQVSSTDVQLISGRGERSQLSLQSLTDNAAVQTGPPRLLKASPH